MILLQCFYVYVIDQEFLEEQVFKVIMHVLFASSPKAGELVR